MSFEPVNGWDARVLAVNEATFGTPVAPAAAQGLEFITLSMGPSEVGVTRPKKDRNLGRGMQGAFVEGRVQPIDFSLETTCKSRVAVDTVPKEDPIYRGAGLNQIITGGVNIGYYLAAAPVEGGAFLGLGLYRSLGGGTATYEAEQLRGGVVKALSWSFGDKEVTLKATGAAIGKYHQGNVPSITLSDGVGTALTISAEESYRLSVGYYQCESEIIRITSIVDGATSAVIARSQLGSSGAAHSAKPLYPYLPVPTYAGSPISEANVGAITVDGVTLRILSGSIDFTSGMDLLPGESGSRFIQGVKTLRYNVTATLKLVLHKEDVSLLGKARARKSMAVSIVVGAGTGQVLTFALPQAEIDPIVVPDTANDVAIVSVKVKGKDSATGNDMFSLVLT